jgi:Skp family chaperone for outer membrane proteins
MKTKLMISSLFLALCFTSLTAVTFAAETKKVCVKEYDNKTKKEKEVCKTIKVHKKLEGTKIPEKK